MKCERLTEAVPLEHRHIARCSASLQRDTAAVEAWGRARWPNARVMHELRVGGCRIDIAFVSPTHLVGVEIKSERDTLDRLSGQLRNYMREIPEVWIAVAVKLFDKADQEAPWNVGRVLMEDGEVREDIPLTHFIRRRPANPDMMLTTGMLHLLWRAEVGVLAASHGIRIPSRMSLPQALPILARKLTGDQIVAGVCGALRSRVKTGGYVADPAITPAGRAVLATHAEERP